MYEEISKLDYVSEIVLEGGNMRDPFRFSALKNLGRLETLEISGYRTIDEEDLGELGQLTQLRKLVVEDKHDIPPDVLARLHTELPNCRVVGFDEDW